MRLSETVVEGIKSLYGETISIESIQVQSTRKDFEGDLTIVTFPLLRQSKKSPEQTGEDLGSYLLENIDVVSKFNIVKGFLNISFSNAYWIGRFNDAVADLNYGFSTPNSGSTVMVEYSSPNTNKPLHLGHIRNNLLGYSVAEILKANGHKVVKVQVINDRGIHICKSMLAYQKWGNGEEPTSKLKGDKLVGNYYVEFEKHSKKEIQALVDSGVEEKEAKMQGALIQEAQAMLRKWEAKDPEVYALWEKMNGWCYDGFNMTYKNMGVDFDKLYYESTTYLEGKTRVEEGIEKGVFFRKEDGSVWCDLAADGLDEKLVLRADGTSVYMTQDIGTAIFRYNDYPDLSGLVYTVGNEQDYHFKVLFLILKKLGFSWAESCYHLSYGMVGLPKGMGKMKSREGTAVDADDLMEEMARTAKSISEELGKLDGMSTNDKTDLYNVIGMGALKYFMLKVDPKKSMVFNPEESVDFTGNTGPFIQYTHARICSILSNVDEKIGAIDLMLAMEPCEKMLIKLLDDYPRIIKEAGAKYSPSMIANYAYELVKGYNHFYQTVPILKVGDENILNFRIVLSRKVKEVIASAMQLLGVKMPERM
ncbi:MAG: arginine--tRNA ligase [Flavobacteriales bacterium]|nr:arginine--tRNA ligase [Flavobacteriales bacterium]